MTQEEIEKAAFESIDAPCVRDCDKCNDKYKNDCMWSIYRDGFVDGAKWRIKKVWHNEKEMPQIGSPILVAMYKGVTVLSIPNKEYWDTLVKDMIFVRWAYVKDLMPIE